MKSAAHPVRNHHENNELRPVYSHYEPPLTDIDIQRESDAASSPRKQQIIISEPAISSRELHPPRSKIVFQGFAFELQLFLREQRRQQLMGVSEAEVLLMGQEVRSVNKCVPFCCGFLGAYIYCLCNCLFCCNCRQKVVYTLYEVHLIGYENIVRLVQACPNLVLLRLRVRDNYLGEPKAIALEEALRMGSVKRFQLINEALGISAQAEKYYEDFAFHFKRLRQLRIETTIKWEDTVVT